MSEKLRKRDKALLTIEELAHLSGISRELVAKLVKEEVIVSVGDKTSLEGMFFHENAGRIIQRWEERMRRGEDFRE